jgi:hypothetical protein
MLVILACSFLVGVWKYVKSKRQESGGIAPLKKGTNLISDSKGKAELLLNQFKSVFTKPTNNDQLHIMANHHAKYESYQTNNIRVVNIAFIK